MNKKDFVKLCFNFNKEPNEDLYELWEYNLRAFDEQEIRDAFNKIILTEKYFPNLNKVLEVVKEVVKKENLEFNNESVIKEKIKKFNINPQWLNKEITNQAIDKETEETYNDFQNFLKEFREA